MEPVTIATTLATLVLTKTFEKAGENLAQKVIEKGGELGLLKSKLPSTAKAIGTLAQNPELAEQHPENDPKEVLVEQVEEAAKTDPKIAAAV